MNTNENPLESDWNTTPLKTERDSDTDKKKAKVRPKENRNFCERWLSLFSPWLTRCENDSNRPFCRACQRPLDNNRFRLQRHERTAKHSRNQEILLNEGEDAVRLLLCRYRQRKRYIKKDKQANTYASNDEDISIKDEIPFKKLEHPKSMSKPMENNQSASFMYTKQECHDINDYYYSPHQYSHTPQPKKDSFDLFFEAISATVKNLPPKLAAEVKSRISQVIAEFELRAICEKEAQEKTQQSVITLPSQATSVVTVDPVGRKETNQINSSAVNAKKSESGSTVTQYVYSYQQKREN